MTTIRDRQSEAEAEPASVPWDMRPIYGEKTGFPWWAAIVLALGLTIVDIILGWHIALKPAFLFSPLYFIGCIAAVCVVQRRSVFGPMVQPPLIFGITVPVLMMFGVGKGAASNGNVDIWTIVQPLINGFPTMALTTALTVLIGFIRITRERNPQPRKKKGDAKKTSGGTRTGRGGADAEKSLAAAKPTRQRDPHARDRRPTPENRDGRPARPRQQSGEFPTRSRDVPRELPRDRAVPPRRGTGETPARGPVRRTAPPPGSPRRPTEGGSSSRVPRPWDK